MGNFVIKALRRRASHVLARLCVLVDPDPPLKFTTRRIDSPITEDTLQAVADAVGCRLVGRGISGQAFTKSSGTDYRY